MIADDAIEALKKIGHEAVAHEIFEAAGGIHNRASFLTTLQDMAVRKGTLKRRPHPTGKGYLYRLLEWSGGLAPAPVAPVDRPTPKAAPVTRAELQTAFNNFQKSPESSAGNDESKASSDFEIEQGDQVPVLGLGSYVINTKTGAFLLEIHDGGARLRRIV